MSWYGFGSSFRRTSAPVRWSDIQGAPDLSGPGVGPDLTLPLTLGGYDSTLPIYSYRTVRRLCANALLRIDDGDGTVFYVGNAAGQRVARTFVDLSGPDGDVYITRKAFKADSGVLPSQVGSSITSLDTRTTQLFGTVGPMVDTVNAHTTRLNRVDNTFVIQQGNNVKFADAINALWRAIGYTLVAGATPPGEEQVTQSMVLKPDDPVQPKLAYTAATHGALIALYGALGFDTTAITAHMPPITLAAVSQAAASYPMSNHQLEQVLAVEHALYNIAYDPATLGLDATVSSGGNVMQHPIGSAAQNDYSYSFFVDVKLPAAYYGSLSNTVVHLTMQTSLRTLCAYACRAGAAADNAHMRVRIATWGFGCRSPASLQLHASFYPGVAFGESPLPGVVPGT